ncbi:DUF742 domain-containing protein [Streptomyces sp. PTM05]|uniref:DUF742 domain-containing protein n=1 Tax=Streptantibioticus parmotrematis TaxID=2873249 RepID=A0ABS7R1W9_9ACTN|nr:DUF742 domain-containing protein [Streptantibioticus parmotrematis]MBY8889468.1 DUF742 domain-containing protein [Streptantibioticus parmotrematis]
MATPPGGHPYGGPQQQPQQAPLKRFNFPSAPSPRLRPGPGQQPEQAPSYDQQPPVPRIEPHMPPPRGAGTGAGGASGGGTGARGGRRTPLGSDQQPLVRPYAMTGGRTRPRYQLAIEALVSTTADPERLRGQLPEHQRICHLCREVKSVAEVSALLSIPLGVARILVADLAEAGLVAIHQPGGDEAAGGQPDVTLLERVLSGLRKL